ncbi:MAG: hypothetical protein J6569_04690 [Gilliamella sp.]|uniref:type II secretion system protein GspD n=1 Tax=Gilliamella sp. TaxID=1891236 RepID=UPI0025E1591C|nr:hypothetical protein [Gilliamella sp.]MCO6539417.1 hypothetical protein [Gilliamella sp.]
MKKHLIIIVILILSIKLSYAKNIQLDIDKMPLPDAISLIWRDVFKTPFMLAPELTTDKRMLTMHIVPTVDEREFIERYLLNMNVKISKKNGVDYIYSFVPAPPVEKLQNFVYKPKFRTVDYLYRSLNQIMTTPVIQNSSQFNSAGSQSYVAITSQQRILTNQGDTLLFRGTQLEIKQLKSLLVDIDKQAEQVQIMAYVFEFQTSEKHGSSLSFLAKLFSEKLDIGISKGTVLNTGDYIKFSSGSFSLLAELFDNDSRFNVISAPHLRVTSGNEARFSVGSDVPVLSSVTYNDNNTKSVQSIEYRSSGVIFTVKPLITQNIITLDINQQLSNFVKTETGVNNSPTLIKREVNTNINLNDGDIVVLGGLTDSKDSNAKTGVSFLPFFNSKSNEKNKTDILVALSVSKIKN